MGIAVAILAAFLPVRAAGSLWWHHCPHHFGELADAAGRLAPAAEAAPDDAYAGHEHHDHAAHMAALAAAAESSAASEEGHAGHDGPAAACTCTAYDCGGHGVALAPPVLELPNPIADDARPVVVTPALLPRAVVWTLPFAHAPPLLSA